MNGRSDSGGPPGDRVIVQVHEHPHEVPLYLIKSELSRTGPPPKLPLLEAIIHHGDRDLAVARLANMLDSASVDMRPRSAGVGSGPSVATNTGPSASPGAEAGGVPDAVSSTGPGAGPSAGSGAAAVAPGVEHALMHAALGLLRLSAREPVAIAALSAYAARLGGSAGAIPAAGVILLRDGPAPLCVADADPLLLRQATRALCAIGDPSSLIPSLPPLFARWIVALQQATKTLGVQAFRAYLGDVSETLYRLAQRARPAPDLAALLSDADRGLLLDTLIGELPGTADFLAARQMVWLVPLLGLLDDAGIAAIERARDRFRNEAFHADCALILGGGTWPPRPPR